MSKRVEKDMKKNDLNFDQLNEEFDLAREEIIARHEMEESIDSTIKMAGWCEDYESSIVLYAEEYGIDTNLIDADPFVDYDASINPDKAALSKVKNTLRKFRLI